MNEYDIDVAGKSAGTYTITVVAKGKTFSANVVIKNTQAAANVKVINSEYTGDATVEGVTAMLPTKVEFYYNGKKIENPVVTVPADQVKINGSQVYVGTVKVKVQNSKGTVYDVNATVNTTFTAK